MNNDLENISPDVMIVFGAGVGMDGEPGPALTRRVLLAARLFDRGVSENIIMTGGVGRHPPAEAEVMKRLAVQEGTPEENIIIENRSTTTFQSVVNCLAIMQRRNWLSAHLVTDPFHMPRCKLTFRMLGMKTTGSAAKGGEKDYPKWKWLYYYAREMAALPFYVVLALLKRPPRNNRT